MSSFYFETLPSQTANLVKLIQGKANDFAILNTFYLSGGTGLSLQIGHRESEDLDFFSRENFNPEQVEQQLQTFGQLSQTELAKGTLNTFLNGVKLQFLEYPYDLIEPLVYLENIAISSIADIACTKLQTIGMRGSKKDFIDLYFLFERYSLDELFNFVDKKYSKVNYSKTHILKSLVYFSDAELQPMPRMHSNVSWSDVKKKMITVTKQFQIV